jgi:hypothetical protein
MSTLAVENLFNQVSASFAADGILATNLFGWRVPTQHPYGPRVAWVPGDPSNSAGLSTAPRGPGGVPRSLGMLRELFTVYFTAQDPADPENELAQYHIVRMLHDAWYRAVYHTAFGTFWIRSEAWETKRSERRHGATLRVVCEILAPILDRLPDPPLIGTGVDQDLITDAVQDAIDHGTTMGADIDVLLVDDVSPMPIPPGSIPPITGDDGEAGGTGQHVQSQSNKNMPALTTVADGDLACAVGLQSAPEFEGFINVAINGLMVTDIGNATRVGAEAYFSNDGGLTARAWNAIAVGDTIHWQGSVAGYQLAAGDRIDVWYEERG